MSQFVFVVFTLAVLLSTFTLWLVRRCRTRRAERRHLQRTARLKAEEQHLDTQAAAIRSRLTELRRSEVGQDIAEYAVMLAVILVIAVSTDRLVGGRSNGVFSNAASQIVPENDVR